MPVGGSRWHMLPRQIALLVASAAMYARDTISVGPTPHIHRVPMFIVSLAGKVSLGVTIHTSRAVQHWRHGFKRINGCIRIARRPTSEFAVPIAREAGLSREVKYQHADPDH
jgi:hypothetical protein